MDFADLASLSPNVFVDVHSAQPFVLALLGGNLDLPFHFPEFFAKVLKIII